MLKTLLKVKIGSLFVNKGCGVIVPLVILLIYDAFAVFFFLNLMLYFSENLESPRQLNNK